MILKYVLNSTLLIIALSFIAMCIFKTTELSSRFMQTAVAISCWLCHLLKEDIKIRACLHCTDSYRNFFFKRIIQLYVPLSNSDPIL